VQRLVRRLRAHPRASPRLQRTRAPRRSR
jgi:hypothetical protein